MPEEQTADQEVPAESSSSWVATEKVGGVTTPSVTSVGSPVGMIQALLSQSGTLTIDKVVDLSGLTPFV